MSTLPAVTAEELAARSGEGWPPGQVEEEQGTQENLLDEEVPFGELSFDDEVVDDIPDVVQEIEETPVDLPQSAVDSDAEIPIDETLITIPGSGDFLEDSPEAVPEDPDEAMAWLERLAARQGASAEELPSFSEERPSISTVDAGEMPEDPDEAMAWLEKMSRDQEEPDEEMVVASQEILSEPGDEGFEGVDEAIEAAVAEEEVDITPPVDEELVFALSGLEGRSEEPGVLRQLYNRHCP